MPKQSTKGKKKKSKQKQKQKQKQVVKTNVKVNVQSSGGSGGGGSTPSFIPQPFRDTSGENTRLVSLVEQIVARVPRQSIAASAPAYNPANDAASVNAVFNAPINTDVPDELGGVKKKGRKPGSKNKPKPIAFIVGTESENDPQTVRAVFSAPLNTNMPQERGATSGREEVIARRKRRTKAEMEAERKLAELEATSGITRELYGGGDVPEGYFAE